MAAISKTTLKPIKLEYKEVGNGTTYTACMGVLKGLSVAQDAPDENEIQAEFYDSPFDIIYTGKPIKITFDLVNYTLADLPALFGGTYTPASATSDATYLAAASALTSEKEWKLSFQKGNSALVVYRGKTLGTLKKDADGALAYTVTITSLVADGGKSAAEDDKMYAIIGDAKTA